ncbi:hypothetical protein U1299_09390 [Enterococcus cecorum]|uniref:Lipoprotein n=1 Tax=Enterococcus cecorum TaxID=44008 RepID=A0AAW9JN20_9ENTE|nr:hypothetical protein [Enterococcus cecorum]MCJ0572792.1 hypothetical protein [Enterococcus cecorum]MCJ0583169.1 hypothetical protein [Enterococcus cecorum]MCJ0585792.1 hypothetical protein [Enterococcus cecorum]MCJ0590761.1 hypothetical protein [Enterococcus cecorum]MDZ5505148.1 hypothetical protein [Enterococcus cecorum]
MKKVSKMVVVVASLVLAVGLSACGKGQSSQTQSSTSATSHVKKKKSENSSQSSKSATSSTSTVQTSGSTTSAKSAEQTTTSSQSAPKVDDQTIFAQTLNEYRAKSDPEKVASVYAFVDLDGDGQNELLMGDQSNRGGNYISGVYMLFKKKQIAPLGISYAASGGGVRKAVLVYQGGYVYTEEGSAANPIFHGRLIKIVGDHYIIVKEGDFSLENEKAEEKFGLNQYAPLNTDTIQWQVL